MPEYDNIIGVNQACQTATKSAVLDNSELEVACYFCNQIEPITKCELTSIPITIPRSNRETDKYELACENCFEAMLIRCTSCHNETEKKKWWMFLNNEWKYQCPICLTL